MIPDRALEPRRRGAGRLLRAVAIALLLPASLWSQTADPTRPNILWIEADDLSPDLGSYGDGYASTPHLDRLAREGARFTRAFATSPVCAPSRSTLITGVFATTLGSHHMRSWAVPPPHVRPFPELLRRAGYYTTNNRKIDYNFNPHLEESRSRAVFEPPLGVWDESGEDAHWRHRAPGQPFFAIVDLFETHESRIRLPEPAFARLISGLDESQRHHPADAPLPPYYPDDPRVRRDLARYHDLVSVADRRVGDLLAELEADGLAESTIVVFFGDHGRGLPRAKRWAYDSGLRVPLIVRWPEVIEEGSLREDLVSFVDYAPTMLALAGVEPPEHMQGRIFLGRRTEPEPPFVVSTRDRMDRVGDTIRSLRGRRFHYLRNFEPEKPYAQHIDYMDEMPTMQAWRELHAAGSLRGPEALFFAEHKPEEELYDTLADPHEVRNLAGSPAHAQRIAGFREALSRWQEETGDLGRIPEAELIARMRPDGASLVTAAPTADPPPGTYDMPVEVALHSATPGAVVVYTTETGDDPHWRLYVEPVPLGSETTLRVQAGRLGYFDSTVESFRYSFDRP